MKVVSRRVNFASDDWLKGTASAVKQVPLGMFRPTARYFPRDWGDASPYTVVSLSKNATPSLFSYQLTTHKNCRIRI